MQRIGGAFVTRKRWLFCAAGLAALAMPLALSALDTTQTKAQSQSQNAAQPPYEFEVASIKPSPLDASGGYMTNLARASDRFSARNLELMKLIRAAYGIPMAAEDSRITGGPSWLRSEKYDVDAKIDGSMVDELKTLSQDQRTLAQQQMLQALLRDRCKLAIRRETKDLAIYTLVSTKSGPKLQDANPGETSSLSYGGGGATRSITGQARSIANFAQALSVALGCPVVDKTGLTSKYDFKLEWTPDDNQEQSSLTGAPNDRPPSPPDSIAPSIFEAIQEQLGLKLVSGKGPVDTFVIDHAERPSAN
jgi:bla regulator protein BlaR1